MLCNWSWVTVFPILICDLALAQKSSGIFGSFWVGVVSSDVRLLMEIILKYWCDDEDYNCGDKFEGTGKGRTRQEEGWQLILPQTSKNTATGYGNSKNTGWFKLKELKKLTRIQCRDVKSKLFANLATRMRCKIGHCLGAICIGCKFPHQAAPITKVTNLTISWWH